jgi:hypothetical protein
MLCLFFLNNLWSWFWHCKNYLEVLWTWFFQISRPYNFNLIHFSNSRTFELGSKLDLIPHIHPQMFYCMGTKLQQIKKTIYLCRYKVQQLIKLNIIVPLSFQTFLAKYILLFFCNKIFKFFFLTWIEVIYIYIILFFIRSLCTFHS